jgi:integrase/recombinase XerD
MDQPQNDLPLFSEAADERSQNADFGAAVRGSTSLKAAIQAWGEALAESGKSIHTVKAFSGDLRLMAKYLGAGLSLSEIGTHDIKNFLDWMVNKRGVPCSPKTYARRVTSIKAFFRWLNDDGVLIEDPAAPVPQQTVLSPLPEVLTEQEVEIILEVAQKMRRADPPDARSYCLVSLLLQTGIKKGECLNIHLNHIDTNVSEGAVLFVRYGRVSKRYRERKLTLDQEWVDAYREYLAQYQPEEQLFPYSPRRLEYLLEDLGDLAGLDKHLSFNMCRWTSAYLETLSGTEKNKIRQKLGISKIQWREVGNKLTRLAAKQGETA